MKISIVTVSYNSSKTIKDTIASVLSQTYHDIEYVVVDGKSKDGTVNIIREYAPQFKGRMHWVSEPDKGLYDAMNKGIRMASGDVVGIINSDDFYHDKDVIKKVANAFQDNRVQATYADVHFVRPENLSKTIRYYSSAKFTLKKFRFGFMPAHPTFFTYKKYFDQFGYYKPDYYFSADFELLVRFLYTHKLEAKYLPIDFLTMRMGGRSTASLKNHFLLTHECIRAAKSNGIYTNMCILSLKYFVKFFEYIGV